MDLKKCLMLQHQAFFLNIVQDYDNTLYEVSDLNTFAILPESFPVYNTQ